MIFRFQESWLSSIFSSTPSGDREGLDLAQAVPLKVTVLPSIRVISARGFMGTPAE